MVLKDRMFENWLVAATSALRSQPKRFRLSGTAASSIAPNNADQTDALGLLHTATRAARKGKKQTYSKIADSKRILARVDINEMAANSRSFRRFLRCLGHPAYHDQSRRP